MLAACGLALLAACGAAAPRARRPGSLSARERPASALGCELGEGDAPRACAVARIDAEAGVVEVTLSLDPAALPEGRRAVRLAFRSDVLGARYAEERVDLVDGGWSLGPVTHRAEVRYRVTLEAGGRGPGTSFRRPGGWHLTGQSFLPDVIVDGERVDVPATLRIDAGDVPLWTAAGSDRRLFDAPSLRRLASEAYEIGALSTTRRQVGATELVVATSGEEDARALGAVADVLAQAVRGSSARLGPPPADAILVALHALDTPARAERLGASLVYVGRDGARGDPIYGAAALVLGELVHFWAPGTHAEVEEWLAEGVSEYLAVLSAAELTGAPAESIARVVLSRRRGATPPDPRELGLVAGFCLDAHLRESGSSLGAALRTTLARDDDEPLGAEALLEDLAAVAPSSASYLAALLDGGAIALDECIERFGFEAREVSYEGWTDPSIALSVLGVTDLRALAHVRGLAIEAIDEEASVLQAGDVLLEVEGVRVGAMDDVAWALRDARPGERVRLTVRRRGEPQSIEIELPQLGDDRREQRAYVELAPIEGDESDAP